MRSLTTHERVSRMYAHKEADRVPISDSPWRVTIERWHREGMPDTLTYVDYFDLDRFGRFGVDNSPQFPVQVVEETDEYVIHTTKWGATLKNWKHIASTPEFLDFTITGPDQWRAAKERMTPTPFRPESIGKCAYSWGGNGGAEDRQTQRPSHQVNIQSKALIVIQ